MVRESGSVTSLGPWKPSQRARAGTRSFANSAAEAIPIPAGGAPIALASSHAAASVPGFVVVPAGQTSAPFTIVTSRVTGNVKATISATYNGVVQKTTLTITR